MTEDELRDMVREAVMRHLGQPARGQPAGPTPAPVTVSPGHPSFGRYAVAPGSAIDGPCLIEPAVRCNHCGYCQSHGH
jgi:hypothetical protein